MTINARDYALLITKLELPMAVRDAIEGSRELDDETHLALHEVLSEMKPDTALLAIAVSAKMIAGAYPDTEILTLECDRIIQEYGPVWLENARNETIDSGYLVSLLDRIPEDLEGLTELIEVNLSYATLDSAAVSDICDIFQIQASAQAIIAEEYLSIMELASHHARLGTFYKSPVLNNQSA